MIFRLILMADKNEYSTIIPSLHATMCFFELFALSKKTQLIPTYPSWLDWKMIHLELYPFHNHGIEDSIAEFANKNRICC